MEILATELQSAHAEWQAAQKVLDEAQDEFVEVAVLELAAAERRYGLLLKMAKERSQGGDKSGNSSKMRVY